MKVKLHPKIELLQIKMRMHTQKSLFRTGQKNLKVKIYLFVNKMFLKIKIKSSMIIRDNRLQPFKTKHLLNFSMNIR